MAQNSQIHTLKKFTSLKNNTLKPYKTPKNDTLKLSDPPPYINGSPPPWDANLKVKMLWLELAIEASSAPAFFIFWKHIVFNLSIWKELLRFLRNESEDPPTCSHLQNAIVRLGVGKGRGRGGCDVSVWTHGKIRYFGRIYILFENRLFKKYKITFALNYRSVPSVFHKIYILYAVVLGQTWYFVHRLLCVYYSARRSLLSPRKTWGHERSLLAALVCVYTQFTYDFDSS